MQVDGPLQNLWQFRTEGVVKMCLRFGYFLYSDGKASVGKRFECIAVNSYTEIFGTNDSRTLTAMNNLASTYRSLGQMNEAAELHEKVLEARQRTLGTEHPATLSSMYNLATTYWELSRSEDAIHLFRAELTKCHNHYGAHHKDTVASCMNLIGNYHEVGLVAEAEGLLTQYLESLSTEERNVM